MSVVPGEEMGGGGPERSRDGDGSRPRPPASAGLLCPFCGTSQPAADSVESGVCRACKNRLDPMSRIATHNAMGAWFVRDLSNPFAPGCSYETLTVMCRRGRVKLNSVVRGPTTQQFWRLAAHAPGVAVLLGQCHACAERVAEESERCGSCDAVLRPTVPVGVGRFTTLDDRQQLGLPPMRVLADGSDPSGSLDSLVAALGHAEAGRVAVAFADGGGVDGSSGTPGAREGRRGGEARLLWAGLLVSVMLLFGLALWAVVLPALGVRTGVEEITGLSAERGEPGALVGQVAQAGSVEGGAAGLGGAGVDSGASVAVIEEMEEGVTQGEVFVQAGVVAVDEASVAGSADGLAPEVVERMVGLHRAALSGELVALRSLLDAIESEAAVILRDGGVGDVGFSERLPWLAAMYRWAVRAHDERRALEALGVR